MAGPAIGNDAADLLGIIIAPVHKTVFEADLFQSALQHQTTNRPPTLRTGVGPDDDALTGEGKIAEGADHMGCPNPGTREQDDGVQIVHLLKHGKAFLGFLFGGQYDVVLHQFETCFSEPIFRIGDELIVYEWRAHRIHQPIFVYSIDDESNLWLYH